MYKKPVTCFIVSALLALASCKQHYELTSVSRSRILIDKRYDARPEPEAQAFLAPYKHKVDSIMSQYQFCKDYSMVLQKKGQNIQNTLATKQQQLQAAAANFQQKVQQNAYTREQAEAINAGLQKQNSDLQVLNQRLSTEFQTETEKYNNALRDSIQHYLKVYNKDKKYSLILSKAGDNLLYADKALDITNEVIAGLNKAYKPSAKMAASVPAKK